MPEEDLATGVVHDIPDDLRQVLLSSTTIRNAWNDLTPLARNEWICWVISVKKEETRKNHIQRVEEDLLKGKRRPCCWPGCPHRGRDRDEESVNEKRLFILNEKS